MTSSTRRTILAWCMFAIAIAAAIALGQLWREGCGVLDAWRAGGRG